MSHKRKPRYNGDFNGMFNPITLNLLTMKAPCGTEFSRNK